MPPVSKKQQKFMRAVANNPQFAKAAGVSSSVGREFSGPVAKKAAVPAKSWTRRVAGVAWPKP